MFLVTGGAGFIGSHIATRLVERGHSVRVFDSFTSGNRDNLRPIENEIELIEGDLRDSEAVRRATFGVDVIFHHGAVPSIPRSVANPESTLDENVGGMKNLLRSALENGCHRVILASSSAVYGNSPVLPKREDMIPNPLSPYAESKLTMERLCAEFTIRHGLETVVLRYFNAFGPRQDWNSPYALVVPKLLKALIEGESPTVYGDGEQTRDFVYIDNIVHANLLAAEAEGVSGKVLNIASGRGITINSVLAQLEELLGIDARTIYEPAREGDVRDSVADISLARELLGYDVLVPFESGLQRTVAAIPAFARAR